MLKVTKVWSGLVLKTTHLGQVAVRGIAASSYYSTNTSETNSGSEGEGKTDSAGESKVVVVGGNGFVGSAVCRAAVKRGATVLSVSRSGQPKADQILRSDWAQKVTWLKGDALKAEEWPKDYFDGASGVVSCVGSFGSHDFMRKICGTANVAVFEEARRQGVDRAVFISAHDFGPPLRSILRGYFEGKYMAEEALFSHFEGGAGTALRPGMVHGTRYVNLTDSNAISIPLSLIGKPMEVIFGNMKVRGLLGRALPGALQRLCVPAVSADTLGKASMEALLDPIPQDSLDSDQERIVDVWQLLNV